MQKCFAFLLAATAVWAGLAPVHAGVLISGAYYEDTAYATCPTTSSPFCHLMFSATPVGKFLTITNVNCNVMRSAPHYRLVLGISTSTAPSANRAIPLPITAGSSVNLSGAYVNAFAEEVRILVGPNRYPFIFSEARASSIGTIECTITGTLTNQ